MSDLPFGRQEGDICHRTFPGSYGMGCTGIIALTPVENCSCHIAPPCGACVDRHHFCPVCEWHETEDIAFNDHIVHVDPKTQVWKSYELRKLDATKVDWHSFSHTNSSMIKRGVYPEGMAQEKVRNLVDGSFGGRFTQFGDGTFEFIAYTD